MMAGSNVACTGVYRPTLHGHMTNTWCMCWMGSTCRHHTEPHGMCKNTGLIAFTMNSYAQETYGLVCCIFVLLAISSKNRHICRTYQKIQLCRAIWLLHVACAGWGAHTAITYGDCIMDMTRNWCDNDICHIINTDIMGVQAYVDQYSWCLIHQWFDNMRIMAYGKLGIWWFIWYCLRIGLKPWNLSIELGLRQNDTLAIWTIGKS